MTGQKLLIDLSTGKEQMVPLTADELAQREADERESLAALEAERDHQDAIRADLDAVADEPTRRLLTLILRRLGEIAP